MADIPITREEKYLAYLTGDYKADIPKPITRQERYLYELCLKGMGGEISPEEIRKAVNDYLDKNPVKPGATTEEAAQIKKNAAEINSLKESKITKFYASNQGKTNLQDSDNGKIMDMMLYGKSEQKQYSGKNLLNATLQTITQNGVTCTNNGDGTYTLNGTTIKQMMFPVIDLNGNPKIQNVFKGCKLIGAPTGTTSTTYCLILSYYSDESTWIKETYDTNNGVVIEDSNIITIHFLIREGATLNNVIFKPMITKDISATYDDFEPYTGGIPSPNPSYPQEIKSVVNPTVKVCGKNLFKPTLQNASNNDVTCTNNGDGTYVLSGENTIGAAIFTIGKIYLSSGKKYRMIGTPKNHESSYLQLRTPENTEFKADISDGSEFMVEESGEYIIRIYHSTGKYNNVIFKPMITLDLTATYDDYEPYHEQTVTLPYTLNAIPVSSGGNVTIDGQPYVSDYVDVERGKLVRMCKRRKLFEMSIQDWGTGDNGARKDWYVDVEKYDDTAYIKRTIPCLVSNLCKKISQMPYPYFIYETIGNNGWRGYSRLVIYVSKEYDTFDTLKEYIGADTEVVYQLKTPEETDLTTEEIKALKALATYYPVTNIFVNSEQLDGYTVFNYPISMENGWNYVKQQIGDTRDYIYDMDARTQDTDLQAAEAYVNSEYAVALTELEV